MSLLTGALTMGCILALMALGVFLTFRIFGFADLATDSVLTLGAAVAAVLHAFQQLRDEGVIELRRGRGAVVTAVRPPGMEDVRTALGNYVRAGHAAGLPAEALITLLKEALRS